MQVAQRYVCRSICAEIGCGVIAARTMRVPHFGHGAVEALLSDRFNAATMTVDCSTDVKKPVNKIPAGAAGAQFGMGLS